METCDQSYSSLLKTLHNICIYSNVFYLIAGLYALISFRRWYRLMGLFILIIGVVSVIHHSNENLGIDAKVWGVLDVVLANVGAFVAIVVLVYLLTQNKTHIRLAIATFTIAITAIIMFIFSEIESSRAKKNLGSSDPTKSWGGKIFTAEPTPKDYLGESQQAMFLCYHTIWHILSGLTAIFWVLSVNSKKAK